MTPTDQEKQYSREDLITVCEKLRGWIFKHDHEFEDQMNKEIDKLAGRAATALDGKKIAGEAWDAAMTYARAITYNDEGAEIINKADYLNSLNSK